MNPEENAPVNDDATLPASMHASPYKGTYLEFLGFRLTAWKEGFVRVEMAVRPEHRNTVGFLHGGVMASLLDIAGAFSGSHGIAEDYVSVSVNLNCNFIAPHRADTVVIEGELIRRTKTLFFAQARLYDPENKRLCATSTGTYKPQRRKEVNRPHPAA